MNPIQEHEMLEQTSIYDEPDVRGTLLLINGGVTSAVLRNVTKGLKGLLFSAFEQFKASGHRSEAELQIKLGSATDLERRSLRIGAPQEYNMKCYGMAFPPATVGDFLSAGSGDGIECVTNMLMWMYNENANATRYNTRNSRPELGIPGIQEQQGTAGASWAFLASRSSASGEWVDEWNGEFRSRHFLMHLQTCGYTFIFFFIMPKPLCLPSQMTLATQVQGRGSGELRWALSDEGRLRVPARPIHWKRRVARFIFGVG